MAIFLWTGKHETQTSDKSSYMRKLEKMKHYFSTLIQLVKKKKIDLMCVSHLILSCLTFIIFSLTIFKGTFCCESKDSFMYTNKRNIYLKKKLISFICYRPFHVQGCVIFIKGL